MKLPTHFLRAEWNNLIMANYVLAPELLYPYLPHRTELDFYRGQTYISLVGFMFLNTRIRGLSIPYHINFEEVNLRFYVKYCDGSQWKRGTVFIREIVPKPAISFIANSLFGEKYTTMRMKHFHVEKEEHIETCYNWMFNNKWNTLSATCRKKSQPMRMGSEESFIAEHYWGYSKQAAEKTIEYEVAHAPWEIFKVTGYTIDCDFTGIYGDPFSFLSEAKPSSVFMAKGSEVRIFTKTILP